MFAALGLSAKAAKLVFIGLAALAIVAVVFAGYRFVENLITDRVNAAVTATQAQDAAAINAATAKATEAQARAHAAQQAQTMKRLDQLNQAQQQNAGRAHDISGSLNHDLAHSAPSGDSDVADADFARVNRMLECASGAAGSCDGGAVAPADAAHPASSGAGNAPRH